MVEINKTYADSSLQNMDIVPPPESVKQVPIKLKLASGEIGTLTIITADIAMLTSVNVLQAIDKNAVTKICS